MNKSQNRPKRTQREQISPSDARLFKMVKADCFAAKKKKYNRNTFFGNKFNSKKAIFILPTDHDQKLMGKEKQNKSCDGR